MNPVTVLCYTQHCFRKGNEVSRQIAFTRIKTCSNINFILKNYRIQNTIIALIRIIHTTMHRIYLHIKPFQAQ
jgi:hypothetical protein